VDVQEVRKLDAYLKKLFGNARLRVSPKGKDTAEVLTGDDVLGEMTVDNEDGDLSYNFRMEIDIGQNLDATPVQLASYLKHKFGNEGIRVVGRPRKTDSFEVYVGEDFLGVLFIENERGRKYYIFELPILDLDLEGV
jgi:hypothetical protein